jgi:transcriptional regulator with XRE-family HTH domain
MSLYDRVLARNGGERALAVARLKRSVLSTLHKAFNISGIESQSDLARRLRVRRSAVNQVFNGDGNLRVSTLAEYLYEMGYELDVTLVRAGEPRSAALEGRVTRSAIASQAVSASPAFTMALGSLDVVEQFQAIPWMTFSFPADIHRVHSFVVKSWNMASESTIGIPESMHSAMPSSHIEMGGPGGA